MSLHIHFEIHLVKTTGGNDFSKVIQIRKEALDTASSVDVKHI